MTGVGDERREGDAPATPADARAGRPPAPTFHVARRLFRVGLAATAGLAILSLWVQIDGLAGSRGIQPAAEALDAFRATEWGDDWTWRPTLLWLDASDGMLHGLCAAGLLLASLLAVDVAPALCALLLWAVYLSLCWAGGVFMNFQWDTLLTEVLLLAAWWLPWRLRWARRAEGGTGGGADDTVRTARVARPRGGPWRRGPRVPDPESALARGLLWFLLLRFMFESGVVKLTSGDPTWADRTAMTYHYMTQPLPHGLSRFAYHLPAWAHRLSADAMFLVELVVPWLVFLPWVLRRVPGVSAGWALLPRRAAFLLLVGLQVAIGATGNYGFFGLLTCVLCLPLLDDGLFRRWSGASRTARRPHLVRRALTALFAVPVLAVGTSQLLDLDPGWAATNTRLTREQVDAGVLATWERDGFAPAFRLAELRLQPWQSVNPYGLFRVMTTRRPDILVQVSTDGETWRDVDFAWQVDGVRERPGWAQPHMPRLDWQLWFEALNWERFTSPPRPYRPSPWFAAFLERLLDGEPAVLGLLASDPFDGEEPVAVRATVVDDRFTTPAEHAETGAWWARTRTYPTWMTLER